MDLFFRTALVGIQIMLMISLAITALQGSIKAEQEHREGKISDYEMELKTQIFIYQSINLILLLIVNGYSAIELLKDLTSLT